MPEHEVKFATRYIKRKRSNAVGKSFLKSLTEPITNSDDSYRKLSTQKNIFPINIYVNKKKRLVRVIDQAEGMTKQDLEDKFFEYGAAKSGAYEGYSSRGIFGQGISDVLFYHTNGSIKSIKNDQASICYFYEKHDRPYINTVNQEGPIDTIAERWGIKNTHGTIVEFTVDKDTVIHEYDNLVKRLSTFYMLRLINANDTRKINLTYVDTRGKKRQTIIKYYLPRGELCDHKEFSMPFENFDPVKIDVELYKSSEPLQTVGDEQESGLLVHDEKEAVYDLTFFGLDKLPGVDKYFGVMKLTGARDVILKKINDSKRPEEILTDSRDGFNRQHDFYKNLESRVKDWLYPILNEERKKKTDGGLSEVTREKQRLAFNELNKLYLQLAGEDSFGTIRKPTTQRPAGGLEFARDNIVITANKKYSLQLRIDTRIIPIGSFIEIVASKNNVGFAPKRIQVTKPDGRQEEILVKTISICGNNANVGDTIEARQGTHSAKVVISVVPEEIYYPENGLSFHPDYFKAIVHRDSILNLYVDLNIIKNGSVIRVTSSNRFIKLKKQEFLVQNNKEKTNILKIFVEFVGKKISQTGTIEAICNDYYAQARVDITDRIAQQPQSPSGKFKDWDFDDKVPIPFQAIYDSLQGSPTQGYILINPNHGINKYYFGENPQKANIDNNPSAQLYLAELILTESLNVTIPEAIQNGNLAKKSDYDVLYYIALKKHEYGPSIYKYFVTENSSLDIKIDKQIKVLFSKGVTNDKDLVKDLSEREKQMIEMRFGLNEQRPHTLEEISRNFNVTRERIRQIINKALAQKYGDLDYNEKHKIKHDYINVHEKNISSSLDRIITAVSDHYGLGINEIKKRTRRADISGPRQIAMYLMRELMGLSFPSIAKIFKLDHTTAMYAHEKILNGINQNREKKDMINSLIDALKAR
ncbi:MAG: helix-turn-helix domain-containing protein [Patescibacteria group bacterium]|nr:helix-turn-helix domain-containing protein [Patescibacteria group bacterium]